MKAIEAMIKPFDTKTQQLMLREFQEAVKPIFFAYDKGHDLCISRLVALIDGTYVMIYESEEEKIMRENVEKMCRQLWDEIKRRYK